MARIRMLALVALATAITVAAGGCKRKGPTGAPTVSRDPKVTAPTTQEMEQAKMDDLLKDLYPMEPLGASEIFKDANGEQWNKFANGLMIQEIRVGNVGQAPRLGQTVKVLYKGSFPGTNQVFDKNSADNPLEFQLGSKGLIQGFSVGVATMKAEGKRRIFLPASLAYGEAGKLPKIGPSQPLIFEIELLSVTGDAVEIPATTTLAPMGPPAPATSTSPATTTAPPK